jgi:hypothetical protein
MGTNVRLNCTSYTIFLAITCLLMLSYLNYSSSNAIAQHNTTNSSIPIPKAVLYIHLKGFTKNGDTVIITLKNNRLQLLQGPWREVVHRMEDLKKNVSNIAENDTLFLCVKSVSRWPGQQGCSESMLDPNDRSVDFYIRFPG